MCCTATYCPSEVTSAFPFQAGCCLADGIISVVLVLLLMQAWCARQLAAQMVFCCVSKLISDNIAFAFYVLRSAYLIENCDLKIIDI